ncbi:RidA family protein [Pyruvatibacter sp.]|uniref:RidA family protein n=1 Tax=Pyruvatibacter sp. TaxID=1981328 RepID=UPI00326429C3
MAGDLILPEALKPTYQNFKFAPGVRAGGLLHMSGILGTGADGAVPADPAEEFEAAFQQAKLVLGEARLDFTDIVEMTTFHIGLQEHIGTFMAVKDKYINEPYPAWTAVGTTELAFPGARMELKITALAR